jgi:hypothetical protein
MKKSWQEKSKDKPSSPEVLGLDNGFLCHNAVREIRLAWRFSIYTGTLSYLHKR